MKEHITEIVIGVSGIATTAAAWFLGGRQKASNESSDVLTRGADQIVTSTQKLLEQMDKWLLEERERAELERKHKESCEKALAEHKRMIDALTKKVKLLENQIK